ncbi:MAG: hypothetical protein K0R57_1021 [Paenibacillaceae bacterium]|nr:hypothetical protein [Paenibacillaceae bacterium]
MRPMNKKMIASAVAAAVILSGAGLVHNRVFAADAATDTEQPVTQQQAKLDGGHAKGGLRGQGQGGMDRGQGEFAGRSSNLVQQAAAVLGLEEDAVKTQLEEGQTLVQIAQANGVAEADFLAKLVALETASIDAAVASGKLTQEQADARKTGLSERLKQQIAQVGIAAGKGEGRGREGRQGPGKGQGGFATAEELAEMLGLSVDELQTQQQAGKSLAEIAAAAGITQDQLIGKLKDSLTDDLTTFVERKGELKQPSKRERPEQQESAASISGDTAVQ